MHRNSLNKEEEAKGGSAQESRHVGHKKPETKKAQPPRNAGYPSKAKKLCQSNACC